MYNIFNDGLFSGISGTLKRPDKKCYFIEDRKEGWKVFIRVIVFIKDKKVRDKNRFIVVKTSWRRGNDYAWEPPKGGVEEQDMTQQGSIINIMENAVKREVIEEAKITELENLSYTGYYYQGKEEEYDDKTFFQYHIFTADISHKNFIKAYEEFDMYKENRELWNSLPREKREKNAIGWYRENTKLAGRWSPAVVDFYLNHCV